MPNYTYKLESRGRVVPMVSYVDDDGRTQTYQDRYRNDEGENQARFATNSFDAENDRELHRLDPWQTRLMEFGSRESGGGARLRDNDIIQYARSKGYTGPANAAS